MPTYTKSTPGPISVTAPLGVTVFDIAVIAAGGGGGDDDGTMNGGGGGGGGGYENRLLTVVPTTTYATGAVGAAGSAGTVGGPGSGGGDTYLYGENGDVAGASGGGGGLQGGAGGTGGIGGSGGGTGGILIASFTGGNGATRSGMNGGGAGSSAGTASNGNNGIGTTGGAAPTGGGKGGNANTQAGTAPGGGGGGANSLGTARAGAVGKAVVQWDAWEPFTVAGASPYATAVSTNWTGTTVDFNGSGTTECWAVQNVGSLGESGTLSNKIQESDTGLDGSWTDIPGAAFAVVTSANQIDLIKFTRTKRYLRGAGAVTGAGVLWTFNIVIGDESLADQTFGDVLGAVLYTSAVDANWTGSDIPAQIIDFDASPTMDCWAVWNNGDFEETGVIDGKIQESDTGVGDWTDIPGVAFGPYESANHVQAFLFTRTKRYLQATGNVSGSGVLATLGIAIGDVVEPPPPAGGGDASVRIGLSLGTGL